MKKLVAYILILGVFLGILPVNAIPIRATETKLPFTIDSTDYGIINENVKAKKLVLTSENAEVIDTQTSDMLLVKESTSYGTVKVYVIGVKGLLHTYEVNSDSEWLNDITVNRIKLDALNSDISSDVYYQGKNNKIHTYIDNYVLSDSVRLIKNPDTGKYDLLNFSTGKFYMYGMDEANVIHGKNSETGIIVYKIGDKKGLLDEHGEKITEAIYDEVEFDFRNGEILTCRNENGIHLFAADGSYISTDTYTWVNCYEDFILAAKLYDADYLYEYYYIDLETLEKTAVYKDTLGESHDFEQYFESSNNFLLETYDSGLFKAYLVNGEEKIDLNDKLGGSYCKIKNYNNIKHELEYMSRGEISAFEEAEFFYAEAYDLVLNEAGKYEEEYYYQGIVDAYGNIVYGFDSPGYSNKQIYWYDDGYMIIRDRVNTGQDTYIVMDTNGTVYYRASSNNGFAGVSVSEEYMSFGLTEDNMSILINRDTGEVTEYPYHDLILLKDEWRINDQQYAWMDCGGYYKIQNLATGAFFEFSDIYNGYYDHIKDIVFSEDEKQALILLYDVKNDELSIEDGVILNENLELVHDVDILLEYITSDMTFAYGGIIYNYEGEIILENYTNSLGDNIADGILVAGKGEESYNRLYTHCDYNGKLFSDYIYNGASEFSKGLACVYSKNYSWEGTVIVIDSNNEHIIEVECVDRFDNYYRNAMRGEGLILKYESEHETDGYYLYDFSDVERKTYSDEEKSLSKDEEEEKNRLLQNAEKINDFKLSGMNTSFTLPENIPVIGGEMISMDFSLVPIIFEKSGNTFRAGIGLSYKQDAENTESLFGLSALEWNNLKKAIDSGKENITAGKNILLAAQYGTVSNPAVKGLKANVCGYLDGVIEDGQIKISNGTVKIKFAYSVGKKWQTVVVSVPVVISAKLEAGVDCEMTIGVDLTDCKIISTGVVEFIMPSVRLSAGVGVAYVADVSVYGEMKNILEFSQGESASSARVRDYIDGEMGISVYALSFEHTMTLWNGKRKIVFDSADGVVKANEVKYYNRRIEQEEFEMVPTTKAGTWECDSLSSSKSDSISVLQENVYAQANPNIITTDSGIKMMIYTASDSERTIGNQTALMYSLYDTEKDTWQTPEYVEDDGTADFYPEIVTDGTDIYLTWMDTETETFSADSTLEEVAASCEINVAKYNAEEKRFSEVTTLTDNEYVDMRPSLIVCEGKLYAVWSSNLNNDLIGLSGENQIHIGMYDGNDWSISEVPYAVADLPVISTCMGMLGDTLQIMYVIDADGDVATVSDKKIYLGTIDEGAKNVFTEQNNIMDAEFGEINDQNVVVLSTQEGLYCTEDMVNLRCLLNADNMLTDYHIVNGNDTDMIIGSKASQAGNNIFAYNITGDKVSDAIQITEQDSYIRYPNGFYDDGYYYLTFTKSDFSIEGEEGLSTTTDICCMKIGEYTDLRIENINVLEDSFLPEGTCVSEVEVKNNGIERIEEYQVIVKSGDTIIGERVMSSGLEVGETQTVDVNLSLPDNIKASDEISCEVLLEQNNDLNQDNNVLSAKIGQTNLQLCAFRISTEDTNVINAYINNDSYFSSSAVLNVYDTSKDGELLYTTDIGVIDAYDLKKVELSPDMIECISNLDSVLYFEVVSEQDETCLSDNYSFIYNNDEDDVDEDDVDKDDVDEDDVDKDDVDEDDVDEEDETKFEYVLNSDGASISISGCTTSSKKVDIPAVLDGFTVSEIADNAFEKCTSIEEVSFPDTLTRIGNYAFSGCTGLQKVELPDSLTSLGDYVFNNCVSLTTARINNGRKNITIGLFQGCSSLSNIKISDSVLYVRENAFNGCVSLKKISLPKSIAYIYKNAFLNSGIINISYAGISTNWKNITIQTVGNQKFLAATVTGADGSTFSANKNNWIKYEKPSEIIKPTVAKIKKLKVKPAKKKLIVSWKKASGVSGYQLQISTKKNFKGAKIINLSSGKKSYTKKKLKSKKKYYIRIRAYKQYWDEYGWSQNVYGKWVTTNKKTE